MFYLFYKLLIAQHVQALLSVFFEIVNGPRLHDRHFYNLQTQNDKYLGGTEETKIQWFGNSYFKDLWHDNFLVWDFH